jgi:hypothetical protein
MGSGNSHDPTSARERRGKKFHKAAGPIRNEQMLVDEQPDLVVACHDHLERSKGTVDMVERAHAVGVPVAFVRSDGQIGRGFRSPIWDVLAGEESS